MKKKSSLAYKQIDLEVVEAHCNDLRHQPATFLLENVQGLTMKKKGQAKVRS